MLRKALPYIAITLLGAVLACSQPNKPPALASVLRRGLAGEPSTLDPAGAADAFTSQVIQDLYEGLTTQAPAGGADPGVASSWDIDATGTQYTFHIRPDARWSNGQPLRAGDFVRAWRRVVDPKTASPLADDLRLIRLAPEIIAGKLPPGMLGVAAPTDDRLVVTLALPAPYLPEVLTHPAAFPIYSEASARTHIPAELVSNGPYVLSRWQNGSTITLKKNSFYWDRADVSIGAVAYAFISDETSQYAQYRAGELDITDTVPASAVPSFHGERAAELVVAPYLATAYYGLNLSARAIGTNTKLRQALSMAIDRKRLVASFGFGQPPAYGLVPPGIWNYKQQSLPWKDLTDAARIAEAKHLYAQAGYSGRTLRLRALYNSNVVIKRTAIMIAAMWKETLGVDTDLIEQDFRGFLVTRHDKTKWDVARFSWVADFNDASNFLDALRSNSGNNDEGYANASYDALLDEAARTAEPSRRRDLLEAAELMALNDYPIFPLYHFVSARLVKPYVTGVKPTPLNRVSSKGLRILAH
ncbi:MAG: peptide ABC transporter substrate-binding protein [Pseudomonadota bacterium]|nr:peptide ABC transporter substrate-binding protein [Pseudomonadota bacterium]